MTATATPRRTYGEALPRQAVATTTSWLRREAPPSDAVVAPPAPCPACGELATLKAELAVRTARADDAGRSEGLRESAALRARLTAAVTALEQAHAAQARAAVDAIVEVALAVCAELAPAAAALDKSGVAALMAQVVGAAGGQPIALKAHPDDAAELGADLREAVRLDPDPGLAPGEIRAHGARLVIDATWATRLAAVREPLVALVRARMEEP
jgi:flagellar biosynthesis/type III secretory pathway protein FliH